MLGDSDFKTKNINGIHLFFLDNVILQKSISVIGLTETVISTISKIDDTITRISSRVGGI